MDRVKKGKFGTNVSLPNKYLSLDVVSFADTGSVGLVGLAGNNRFHEWYA